MRRAEKQNSKPALNIAAPKTGPQKTENKPLKKKNDIFFKSAFEDYFSDMLRFLYKDADQIFDLEKPISFMDKELLEISPDRKKRGGTRNADMLARIHLCNGMHELFLLHVEIQTETNAKFPQRVLTYWYRLTDRYNLPIVSHTIFTGKPDQLQPDKYYYKMLGTELSFKHNTYQIFQHTEEELLQFDNPFALVVLVAQKELFRKQLGELELHNTKIKIIEKLTDNGNYTQQSITRFLLFLENMLHIENKELNLKFEERLKNLTGEQITMGIIETEKMLNIEEGIEIGQLAKQEKVVTNLILQLGLSDAQAAKVADAPLSFVRKIRRQLEKGIN
ncbi:hypothetical protein [Pedobacter nutrimenti]|uniref:hypothetical protein n=1 Tax=Pedobacter nutrimenti TaxID=1241337 RepID=UPI002930C2A5|nr:hypothetical protein [Pedobacter nutrimenti]